MLCIFGLFCKVLPDMLLENWKFVRANRFDSEVQEGDNSCILRQLLTDGCANYFWLKWPLGYFT